MPIRQAPGIKAARTSDELVAMRYGWVVAVLAAVGGCVLKKEEAVTPATLVGTYDLTAVAARCDTYASGGGFNENGKFTSRKLAGWLSFAEDGTVTHHFEISGTCTLPDGSRQEVEGARDDRGTYRILGGAQVEIVHSRVSCTGSYAGGRFTVMTGTLFPPVRFWYTLEKRKTEANPDGGTVDAPAVDGPAAPDAYDAVPPKDLLTQSGVIPTPGPEIERAPATSTMGAVEVIDQAGVLRGMSTAARDLTGERGAVAAAWSFEPSGPLPGVVYLRVPLSTARTPGARLVVWRVESSGPVIESLAKVAEDGRHAVFGLNHFSVHAITDLQPTTSSCVMFDAPALPSGGCAVQLETCISSAVDEFLNTHCADDDAISCALQALTALWGLCVKTCPKAAICSQGKVCGLTGCLDPCATANGGCDPAARCNVLNGQVACACPGGTMCAAARTCSACGCLGPGEVCCTDGSRCDTKTSECAACRYNSTGSLTSLCAPKGTVCCTAYGVSAQFGPGTTCCPNSRTGKATCEPGLTCASCGCLGPGETCCDDGSRCDTKTSECVACGTTSTGSPTSKCAPKGTICCPAYGTSAQFAPGSTCCANSKTGEAACAPGQSCSPCGCLGPSDTCCADNSRCNTETSACIPCSCPFPACDSLHSGSNCQPKGAICCDAGSYGTVVCGPGKSCGTASSPCQ
jgi:hypothetical protein